MGCIYLFEFMFLVFSDICPGVAFLGHIVVLFLVFWETSILFSTVTAPIYIPTNSARVFLFSIPSPAFIVCKLFGEGHSDQCEVISHCGFDLHCFNDEHCWAFLHVLTGHLHIFFGKKSLQVFCPFEKLYCSFFWYWVVWAIYICWILISYQLYHLQIFSPIQ